MKKTSSSVTVSWPKSNQVTTALESYYRYVVQAAASGQATKNVTKQFETGQGDQSAVLVGLRHNTDYEIRVRISDSTQTLGGSPGGTLHVKTKCKGKSEHKLYFIIIWD